MRNVKGQCITTGAVKSIPTFLDLAISASDPLNERAPAPDEGMIAEPPRPDCLRLKISNPSDAPCIVLLPIIFPLSGVYSIPPDTIISVTTNDTVKNMTGAPKLDEFHLWFESKRYGATSPQNYSIQARDTLFTYAQLDAVPFTPKANLVSHLTVIVKFLTPNDPLYCVVKSAVLASKEKAYVMDWSKQTRQVAFTTRPKASDRGRKDSATPHHTD